MDGPPYNNGRTNLPYGIIWLAKASIFARSAATGGSDGLLYAAQEGVKNYRPKQIVLNGSARPKRKKLLNGRFAR